MKIPYTSLILNILLVIVAVTSCCVLTETNEGSVPMPVLKIATTTSLYDTGLLNQIEDYYEMTHTIDLQITSQGTGKAIELAKRGDVDLLLVHSPSQEQVFLDEGYGINHRCVAYNYFLIVGPENDPAGIRGLEVEKGFTLLEELGKRGTQEILFISRGDNSGTHQAEKNIWKAAGFNYSLDIQSSGPWYIEGGKGMGETLVIASEKGAYTLTDEGTYLAFQGQLTLTPIIDQGDLLLNRYSAIAVNPERHPGVQIEEANRFIGWLISEEGKQIIREFGKVPYGKGLFIPLDEDRCALPPFSCDCTIRP